MKNAPFYSMTTIISFFFLSLLIAMVATPFVKKLGHWMGALDYPDDRKIHSQVVPRCGGLAIYLGFFLPFLALLFYRTSITEFLTWDRMTIGLMAGSTFILLVGLLDDIRGLRAWIKLLLQIVAALIAWWAGFRIEIMCLPFLGSIDFAFFSLPVTVFWFVAVINALNLMDGLDGLAVGIALFAAIILALISLLRNNLPAALLFASFSGALLGFLRYNFNPASIFLGDSGSYFIGFILAALGIGTSQKSSVTVAILIPVIALGLPLIDMVFATFRRFIFGIKIFAPDKEHLHHKLLKLGYTHRKATLLFYGITVILGLTALLVENLRDDRAGMILGALAVLSILGIRKLGYLDYYTTVKILGWFADVTDEAGFSHGRRTFLSNQVAIAGCDNIFQFWTEITHAAEKIKLCSASMELNPESFGGCSLSNFTWENGHKGKTGACDRFLRVELPLMSNGTHFGVLHLKKAYDPDNGDRIVLKRAEHLCRTVVSTLEILAAKSCSCPEVLQDRRCVHSNPGELAMAGGAEVGGWRSEVGGRRVEVGTWNGQERREG